MRKESSIYLRVVLAAGVLSALLCAGWLCPPSAEAADPFAAYAEPVRIQAHRVVSAAGPGKDAELSREVRLLQKAMHATGILSMNAVADRVYERAMREGWKQGAAPSLRVVSDVSALSVPMWAWLVKEDLVHARFDAFVRDVDSLAGSVRRFGPALLGCASWLMSFLSAAICWFAIWASVALFLRARPSLEADLARLIRFSSGDYLAAVSVIAIFLLPLFAGFGLAVVSCIWLALSAAYLRRTEIFLMTTVILLLAFLLAGGSVLHSLKQMTGEVQRGGWLGTEGYFPEAWPEASLLPGKGIERESISLLVRFSRGRAAMLAGKPEEAERIWTSLLAEEAHRSEILNNRGIVRAQQGRLEDALADFEEALRKEPDSGPPLWNAYHIYLRVFNLERSRALQPRAWEQVQAMVPYNLRPAEMEQGEWIASPLQEGEIWKSFFSLRSDWILEAGESDIFRIYFHPLTPALSLLFLGGALLVAGAWKVLSLKIWVHRTCRSCGTKTLIVGSRETHEFCNQCRSRIGGAQIDSGEPDRRGQGIVMHRIYVCVCAMLVPGTGWLWAGKEVRSIVYGILLSLSFALLSSSSGAQGGGSIMSDLQQMVFFLAIAVTAILWLAGSVSGVRSFRNLQHMMGIAPKGGRR
jgi:tetratricopeptide (TPR) repeat protein